MLPRIGLNASFSHLPPLAGDLAFLVPVGRADHGHRRLGARRAASASRMSSRSATWPTSISATCSTTSPPIPQSRAILLYMEAVTHAPKFMSAARRAARSKPVIVVKAGRSATGARAALSHTGALAGADAAYDAAFRRAGVLRVRELDDLFDAAEILARHPRLAGDRLAILTNGGGAGVLAADALGDLGGRLAALSRNDRAALDAVLPPTWSHGNPVDIIGDADPAALRRVRSRSLAGQQEADAILVMNCPTALASSTEVAERIVAVLDQRKAAARRRSRSSPPGSATRPAGTRASSSRPRASRASARPRRPSTGSCNSCAIPGPRKS